MKRFLPRTIAGQSIIVLLVGLTVSHLFSMAVYTVDRADVLTLSSGHQIAHRIAAITRLLDETPTEWRENILHATDSQALQVSITPVSRLVEFKDPGLMNRMLRQYLSRLIDGPKEDRVLVQLFDAGENFDVANPPNEVHLPHNLMPQMLHGQPHPQMMRASVRLKDGKWVNFATALPEGESLWSTRAALSMLLMAGGVILLSLWIIRRVTKPLRVFSGALKRFGKDLDAPPLDETGPLEVREAKVAFNEMQDRLRHLIDNRTRLLAAISHDLRTPITLLRLRTEFVGDGEEKSKMLATLDDMEKMVASTLSFARQDSENEPSERVDLAALIGSICDDMTDAGRQVEFNPTTGIVYECRASALKRALANLVENAVKYGGIARVGLKKAGTNIEITVEDDGPGIPEAELGNVFSPFYRVEQSRNRESGGVGLGLSVVQSIIDKHGGDVVLSNRKEGGLRVRVVLPA